MPKSNPKDEIRTQLLRQRVSFTDEYVKSASDIILEKIMTIITSYHPHSMHCYIPIANSNEIDTARLIDFIRQLDDVYLTIGEPHSKAAIPTKQFDMIIVPIVGYNLENYRIGYGGGWYDRFLKTQLHAYSIGLAYRDSLVDFVSEPHDQKLDLIVTN